MSKSCHLKRIATSNPLYLTRHYIWLFRTIYMFSLLRIVMLLFVVFEQYDICNVSCLFCDVYIFGFVPFLVIVIFLICEFKIKLFIKNYLLQIFLPPDARVESRHRWRNLVINPPQTKVILISVKCHDQVGLILKGFLRWAFRYTLLIWFALSNNSWWRSVLDCHNIYFVNLRMNGPRKSLNWKVKLLYLDSLMSSDCWTPYLHVAR